jgi:hypothetical protein
MHGIQVPPQHGDVGGLWLAIKGGGAAGAGSQGAWASRSQVCAPAPAPPPPLAAPAPRSRPGERSKNRRPLLRTCTCSSPTTSRSSPAVSASRGPRSGRSTSWASWAWRDRISDSCRQEIGTRGPGWGPGGLGGDQGTWVPPSCRPAAAQLPPSCRPAAAQLPPSCRPAPHQGASLQGEALQLLHAGAGQQRVGRARHLQAEAAGPAAEGHRSS